MMNNERGLTLIELLIGLAISSLVIGLASSLLINSFNLQEKSQQYINLRQEATIFYNQLDSLHKKKKSYVIKSLPNNQYEVSIDGTTIQITNPSYDYFLEIDSLEMDYSGTFPEYQVPITKKYYIIQVTIQSDNDEYTLNSGIDRL